MRFFYAKVCEALRRSILLKTKKFRNESSSSDVSFQHFSGRSGPVKLIMKSKDERNRRVYKLPFTIRKANKWWSNRVTQKRKLLGAMRMFVRIAWRRELVGWQRAAIWCRDVMCWWPTKRQYASENNISWRYQYAIKWPNYFLFS